MVLSGARTDVFAVMTAPLILVAFVPLCEIGDWETRAQRRVAVLAYAAPWPEVRSPQWSVPVIDASLPLRPMVVHGSALHACEIIEIMVRCKCIACIQMVSKGSDTDPWICDLGV